MQLANYNSIQQRAPRETAELLISRSLYAAMKAQNAGNMVFDGHAPTAEEKNNADECRMLCDKIERQLQFCRVNEIPKLLSCHYVLYLIGYIRMPDMSKLDRYKQHVISAWQGGNKTIEESEVFGLLTIGGSQNNADSEYVKTYQALKHHGWTYYRSSTASPMRLLRKTMSASR